MCLRKSDPLQGLFIFIQGMLGKLRIMDNESYWFKIGIFECMAVSDGTFTYAPPMFPPPATFLFSNAPKKHLQQALLEHNLELERWLEWTSPYICLVVNTGKHRVLVDTGAGSLGPNTGKLLKNLQAEGITPKDIDTVVLTHGHPDHLGGNTIDDELAFPDARFIMWKDEWSFWTSEPMDEHVEEILLKIARKNLLPIKDKLVLIDHEEEVVPGIYAIPAPGHTPGHMTLDISSRGDHLLCISDAVLHPIHVEKPDWHAAIDLLPQQVVDTRHRLFNRAIEEEALVLAFHFPFPGLGRVLKEADQWKWRPI
jgi:glyoxylase-like metal-dependent hydrolase (beta-lactamase superfamily II)